MEEGGRRGLVVTVETAFFKCENFVWYGAITFAADTE
jgi:hypothetical protein